MPSSVSDHMQSSAGSTTLRGLRLAGVLALSIVMLGAIALALFGMPSLGARAASAGGLTVTVLSAPNLVVDSNALAPSTYSPKVATVAGKFCNTNNYTLTNVMGYIGTYTSTSSSRPGIYPARYQSDTGFASQYPWADVGDVYSLTHVGGRLGLLDASRFIGDIPPNSCKYQYWSFSYPHTNPAHDSAVWGETHLTSDDLALRFDVWGTGTTGVYADTSFTVTMRNEISAMANKIQPNPAGQWFNTDASRVLPGQLITSNGILYEFGVINQGFDADQNFVPDFDAWMQPIGDPSYDPSCFRLVKTSGVLTVTRGSGNPDYIYPFTDQLYFRDLPPDNTGGKGNVYYTFLALNGPCSTALSPYQEVASGSENEKFNGDYGTNPPPPAGFTPPLTITKDGTQYVNLGGLITYTIKLKNNSSYSVGSLEFNMPPVISDTIPQGTTLEPGSIVSDTSLIVLYSTDGGTTWSSVQPAPLSSVTNIQYWLNTSLAPSGTLGSSAQVTFTVRMTTTPPIQPFVTNCADQRFGSGTAAGSDCATTYISGTYQGGHYVWYDVNLNGTREPIETTYLPNISTTLYYDLDHDGILDPTDPELKYTETGSTGFYTFSQLYTGTYIVLVNKNDPSLPLGFRPTTPITHVLNVSSTLTDYTLANFGFGPSLTFTKKLASPIYDNGYAYYGLAVKNIRPGGGDQVGNYCRYTVWAGGQDVGNSGSGQKIWTAIQNAIGAPDGLYAGAPYANAGEQLALTGWNLSIQPGNVVTVDVILPIVVRNNTATDDLTVNIITATTPNTPISTTVLNVEQLTSGNLILRNVPGPWTWTDFVGSNRSIQLISTKAGNTNVDFKLDAAGFYVYSDKPCATAEPDDIMTTVPLTDTFDSTKLSFVSSVPPASQMTVVSPTGYITWTNVGPIAPGETKEVRVTFWVSDVNTATSLTNSACTIGTQFSDGGYANNGCDTVTKIISPAGYITGVVWSDVPTLGWEGTQPSPGFSSTDVYRIPGVVATLLRCDVYASDGAFLRTVNPSNVTAGADCEAQGAGNDTGYWVSVTSQTTDLFGRYGFNGLIDAYYRVVLDSSTIPAGYAQTADPARPIETGNNPASGVPNGYGKSCQGTAACDGMWGAVVDNLGGTQNNATNIFPIQNASAITQVNFGYTGLATIFGNIWQDFNGNGLHEATDTGLDNVTSGVTVTLYRVGTASPISTTQTNANGYYSFPGLAADTYTVTVQQSTLPVGGTWTQTAEGKNWGSPCTTCNNVLTATVVTGQIDGSYDFGFHRSGNLVIGDTVYYDWNGDGTQQSNEEGIRSVILSLYRDANSSNTYDPSDPLVLTATTSMTGYYLFVGIPTFTSPVNYYVVVQTSDPSFPTNVNQTGDPDEPGTCLVCNSIGKAVIQSTNVFTIDFGYQPYGFGAIGDTVYRDMNGNGVQDDVNESGIGSITVWLEVDQNNDGTYSRILTTTTDSTGYYLFSNLLFSDLPYATYRVVVNSTDPDLPVDGAGYPYIPSTPTVISSIVISTTNRYYLNADFGFMPLGAVGDTVYWDANGNGSQDWAETGISAVPVTLINMTALTLANGTTYAPGAYVLNQTTSITGFYKFTGLVSGTYSVTVGMTPTYKLTGDPDAYDVPCNGVNPARACDSQSSVWIQVGTINMSQDFGYQPLGVIGDFVFHDLNGNSLQDPGEPGIPGVVITITNNAGGSLLTTTTDYDGKYSFSNLPVNTTWTVTFTQPSGMAPTISSGTAISNGIGSVGLTTTVVINNVGQVTSISGNGCTNCSLHIDSGFRTVGTRTVSGHVFYDNFGNGGIYGSSGDLGYAGIVVNLYDSTNKLVGSTTTVGSSGMYTFTNVPENTSYTVSYNPNSPLLLNMRQTSWPGNNPTGTCAPLCLNYYLPGFPVTTTDRTDLDFGLFAEMDFGDLPDSYGTYVGSDGARHIVTTTNQVYLGTPPDSDGNGQASSGATLDNSTNVNDEDGVQRNMSARWLAGTTVPLTVTVTGSNAYLVAWFDWNTDGMFSSSERVVYGSLTAGTQVVSVTIPGTMPVQLNVRFRVYAGTPSQADPKGLAINGEVEDYQWLFTPTAITLEKLNTQPTAQSPLLLVPIFIVLALLIGLVLPRLIRRRAA